jgi:hypothetical protein
MTLLALPFDAVAALAAAATCLRNSCSFYVVLLLKPFLVFLVLFNSV